MPKRLKSHVSAMSVRTQAMAATKAPAREPMRPEPRERRKAMKARPVMMGCRTMTRVRLVAVPLETSEKGCAEEAVMAVIVREGE